MSGKLRVVLFCGEARSVPEDFLSAALAAEGMKLRVVTLPGEFPVGTEAVNAARDAMLKSLSGPDRVVSAGIGPAALPALLMASECPVDGAIALNAPLRLRGLIPAITGTEAEGKHISAADCRRLLFAGRRTERELERLRVPLLALADEEDPLTDPKSLEAIRRATAFCYDRDIGILPTKDPALVLRTCIDFLKHVQTLDPID